MDPSEAEFRRFRRMRWFGYWYLSIGIGFAMLGVYFWLLGDTLLLVTLRFVISAGFLALGYFQLKAGRQPPPKQATPGEETYLASGPPEADNSQE
jgi:hypothetical protein